MFIKIRKLLGVSLVAALLCPLLLPGYATPATPTAAEVPPLKATPVEPGTADIEAFKEAGDRYVALISEAESSGEINVLRTPVGKALLMRLTDEERMLHGLPASVENMGKIMDICGTVNKVSVQLTLFGMKGLIDPTWNQERILAVLLPLKEKNGLRFQDEYKELLPFFLRCVVKQVPAMSQFVASLNPEEMTEIRRQGLANMSMGVLKMLSGAIIIVSNEQFNPDFRLAVASAMVETVDTYVSITQLPSRAEISKTAAAAARKTASPYREYLQRISEAFKDQTCEILCSMQ
jgi:hypothetical protein